MRAGGPKMPVHLKLGASRSSANVSANREGVSVALVLLDAVPVNDEPASLVNSGHPMVTGLRCCEECGATKTRQALEPQRIPACGLLRASRDGFCPVEAKRLDLVGAIGQPPDA